MSHKQIEVTCTCCSSRLTVDVRTGKVLRTVRAEDLDAAGRLRVRESSWDSVRGRVEKRTSEGQDRLDAALDREKNKSRTLDDLFTDARDRAQGEDSEQDSNPG